MTDRAPAPADPGAVVNGFFDRALVLTLARAGRRQERVRARLGALGIRFDFLPGFDGAALDRTALARDGLYDADRARRVDRFGREMNAGELGASLSHRRAYEEAVRNGWRRVLVFEDDLVPRPADLPALGAALSELPEDWDLVWLGYTNFERVTLRDRLKQAVYVPMAAMRLLKWTPAEVLRFHPKPYSAHLRRAGLHHCAHAYAVSLAGARKLLELQTPVAWVADQLLVHAVLAAKVKAFVTEPQFFDQERYAAPVEGGEPASYITDRTRSPP